MIEEILWYEQKRKEFEEYVEYLVETFYDDGGFANEP